MPIVEDIHNLTPLQRGMLYHQLAAPHSGAYVLQQTFSVAGVLPPDAVRDALAVVAQRHDVLRTAFTVPRSSGTPRQVLLAGRVPGFAVIEAGEPELAAIEARDVAAGFDLERDPLFRVTYVRHAPAAGALIVTAHHIILDGWSLPIIIGDFVAACSALLRGESPDALAAAARAQCAAALRYRDYLRWRDTQDTTADLAYWRGLLAGYEAPLGVPAVYPPEPGAGGVAVARTSLDEDETARLTAAAASCGVTVATVLAATWGLVLQRYHDVDDAVFGTVVSGRDVPLVGVERVPGLFINTLPVRVRTAPDMTVRALLADQQTQSLDTGRHALAALSDIQAPWGKAGVFETVFAFENYFAGDAPPVPLPGVELTLRQGREQTTYPVSIRCSADRAIRADALYDPARYGRDDMELLLRRYRLALGGIAPGLDGPVAALPMVDEAERVHILSDLCGEVTPPSGRTAVEVFADIVRERPDAVALRRGDETVTYAELDVRSNRLARTLQGRGVGPGRFVAVWGVRTPVWVTAMLATMKAGGAYLPIDLKTPGERARFMLEDSGAVLVLVCGPETPPDVGEWPTLDVRDDLVLDPDGSPPALAAGPEDVAYCIYTSGTTGQPKGVLIEHHSLVNLGVFMGDLIGKTARVLQFGGCAFDVSIMETFGPLLNGAEVVLVDQDVILDVDRFAAYVARQGITWMVLPPPYYRQSRLGPVPALATGGTASTPEIVERAARQGAYMNVYGPTEITVISHAWGYPGGPVPDPVPIGKPLRGDQGYVLWGPELRLAGIGMAGELCVGGAGVARGYLNRDDLTAERFVPNPHRPGRLYRTGDMVRLAPDGNVVYLGRRDGQVKVRGFRIELADIEAALRALPGVTDAVVSARPDPAGDLALYAYVTGEEPLDLSRVRAGCAHALPPHMVPSRIRQIEAIPLNVADKPDLSALPDIEAPAARAVKPPRDGLEAAARDIVAEALGTGVLGVDEDFFEAGGDSMKAMAIAARLAGVGLHVTVADIFSRRTVEAIVAGARAAEAAPPAALSAAAGDAPADVEAAWEALRPGLDAQARPSALGPARPLTCAQAASARLGVLGSLGQVEVAAAYEPGRFASAWRALLAGARALATAITLDGEGAWCDVADADVDAPVLDLVGVRPDEQARALRVLSGRAAAAYARPEAYRGTFLAAHRVFAARTAADRFVVVMPVSHLVYDAFSNELLARRLRAAYADPSVVARPGARMEDFDTVMRQGPDVGDDDLVAALRLEEFAGALRERPGWPADAYANLTVPLENVRPGALPGVAEAVVAAALRFTAPTGPLPLLVVNAARSYTGISAADTIGEFIDLVPLLWRPGESFGDVRARVMAYVRAHRVNTAALLGDPELARRFPRASALLAESLPLERLSVQAVNLLLLYAPEPYAPEAPPDLAADAQNAHLFCNVAATPRGITLEGVRCPPGSEAALLAALREAASAT
ncbi:MAG: amino acid adenylation domain-containing protein [Actinomycetia bacterium]|nr:amino acid adenylation domain-containing protein [Actinomycetes bacterium]